MNRVVETVSTINSAVRTFLALVVCGAVGFASWLGYNVYNEKEVTSAKLIEASKQLDDAKKMIIEKNQTIAEQSETITEQKVEIDQLQTRLKLLKIDHRLARLDVLKQTRSEDGKVESTIEFSELNDEGYPIGKPLTFLLVGDMIYIDGLVVKFNDDYVEQADLQRGTSLFAFKRIFTDRQNPKDGFPLDLAGIEPQAYARGGKSTDFEKKIWGDFWSIANDEAQSKQLGIRSNHGQAVSIKPIEGARYKLQLRASDGLSISRDGDVPESPKPGA